MVGSANDSNCRWEAMVKHIYTHALHVMKNCFLLRKSIIKRKKFFITCRACVYMCRLIFAKTNN